MKTLGIILSMLAVFAISSLGQKSNIPELLENKNTRTEIFNTIMNDHELMTDFISAMKGNQHAMMMMKGSNMMGHDEDMGHEGNMAHGHQMMGQEPQTLEHGNQMMGQGQQTMGHAQMMQMLKNDPDFMNNMMAAMMDMCEQDSTFCNNLAETMTEHPGMMQMGMHKMKEKGMMGPDGELIIPESQTERMGHNLKH